MMKDVYYAVLHIDDGQHRYIYTDHRKLYDFLRHVEPLCYEIQKISFDNNHEMYLGIKQTDVKLYTRSDECIIDLLYRLQQYTQPIIYSNLESPDKNKLDVLIRIKLFDIIDNVVILYYKNIKLWHEVYKESFNWYKYYLLDKENDKFDRLKGYYD